MEAFKEGIANRLGKNKANLTRDEIRREQDWDKLMNFHGALMWPPYEEGRLTDFAIKHSAELIECNDACGCGISCKNRVGAGMKLHAESTCI